MSGPVVSGGSHDDGPPRTAIDLDRTATILDLADRIAAAAPEGDLVVIAAAGAPWLRHPGFLEVARRLAAPRHLAIVTSDQRARSLAASVHVAAYASLDAFERRELDATERLLRRRLPAAGAPAGLRGPALTRRGLGIAASLLAAALLLAVVVPEATVVVAPTTRAFGPLEVEIRAGPGGEIPRTPLSETLVAKVQGVASGSREEQIKATGAVQLSNRQTRSIRIPRGSIFRTTDNVRFESTEERTLPASVILGPLPLTIGTISVPIEAVTPGREGNVAAGRITMGPAPADYVVTNPQPTSGGELKKIPIVQRQDYAAAIAETRVGPAVSAAANDRLARWRTDAPSGTYVVPRVYTTVTSLTPESAVVGKETDLFDLSVSFVATAFAVPADEPRKSAIARLRAAAAAEPGFVLSEPTIRYNDLLLDDPGNSGVIRWSVTMSGSLLARVEADRIRRTVVGRGPDEVADLLERAGVRLVELRRQPAWWPRLPVLDLRIRVDQVPATAGR